MLDSRPIETSIFNLNGNSLSEPLIIRTFEKRAPGHLLHFKMVYTAALCTITVSAKAKCPEGESWACFINCSSTNNAKLRSLNYLYGNMALRVL